MGIRIVVLWSQAERSAAVFRGRWSHAWVSLRTLPCVLDMASQRVLSIPSARARTLRVPSVKTAVLPQLWRHEWPGGQVGIKSDQLRAFVLPLPASLPDGELT